MKYFLEIALFLLVYAPSASAYVGPSLGTGTIGVILGILLSIFIALFAILYYPIKRLLIRLGVINDNNKEEENDE